MQAISDGGEDGPSSTYHGFQIPEGREGLCELIETLARFSIVTISKGKSKDENVNETSNPPFKHNHSNGGAAGKNGGCASRKQPVPSPERSP